VPAQSLGEAREIAAALAAALQVVGGTALALVQCRHGRQRRCPPRRRGGPDEPCDDGRDVARRGSLVLLGDPSSWTSPEGEPPAGRGAQRARSSARGDPARRRTRPCARARPVHREDVAAPSDVCAFTSEVFYESKLTPRQGANDNPWTGCRRRQAGRTAAARAGIRLAARGARRERRRQPGGGRRDRPPPRGAVRRATGARWTNAEGVEAPLRQEDIVVVAPYNAHVDRIAAALRTTGLGGVRVGTVDKFQGQQAPLSIYAMDRRRPRTRAAGWSSSTR